MMNHFSSVLSRFSLIGENLIIICLFCFSSCLKYTELLGCVDSCVPARFEKILVIISVGIFFLSLSLFCFWNFALYYFILWYSIGPLGSDSLFSFFFFFLFLRCSNFNWLIFKFAESFFCWLKMINPLVNFSFQFFTFQLQNLYFCLFVISSIATLIFFMQHFP